MRTLGTAGILIALALAPAAAAGGDALAGAARYEMCVTCHGEDGIGDKATDAPAIGGMRVDYLVRQLRGFRDGIRGLDVKTNINTAKMVAMSKTLRDDKALEDISTYISEMKPAPTPATLDGDPKKGEKLFLACSSCHGQDAMGMEETGAPRLALQHDWYLYLQLQRYREGTRGADANNNFAAQMQGMATSLPDDQAVKDVVAYIGTLGR